MCRHVRFLLEQFFLIGHHFTNLGVFSAGLPRRQVVHVVGALRRLAGRSARRAAEHKGKLFEKIFPSRLVLQVEQLAVEIVSVLRTHIDRVSISAIDRAHNENDGADANAQGGCQGPPLQLCVRWLRRLFNGVVHPTDVGPKQISWMEVQRVWEHWWHHGHPSHPAVWFVPIECGTTRRGQPIQRHECTA